MENVPGWEHSTPEGRVMESGRLGFTDFHFGASWAARVQLTRMAAMMRSCVMEREVAHETHERHEKSAASEVSCLSCVSWAPAQFTSRLRRASRSRRR